MRPRVPDLFRYLRLEPLEVLPKEVGQLRGLPVVGFAILPGPAGVEEFAIDPGDLDWDVQAEERIFSRLGVVELAPDHGSHHLAGGGDVYAAPDTVGTARPSGVDQVAAGAVRL